MLSRLIPEPVFENPLPIPNELNLYGTVRKLHEHTPEKAFQQAQKVLQAVDQMYESHQQIQPALQNIAAQSFVDIEQLDKIKERAESHIQKGEGKFRTEQAQSIVDVVQDTANRNYFLHEVLDRKLDLKNEVANKISDYINQSKKRKNVFKAVNRNIDDIVPVTPHLQGQTTRFIEQDSEGYFQPTKLSETMKKTAKNTGNTISIIGGAVGIVAIADAGVVDSSLPEVLTYSAGVIGTVIGGQKLANLNKYVEKKSVTEPLNESIENAGWLHDTYKTALKRIE